MTDLSNLITGLLTLALLAIAYFLRQNYTSNKALSETIIRLDKTLAVVSEMFGDHKKETKEKLNCHENRISTIEKDVVMIKTIIE